MAKMIELYSPADTVIVSRDPEAFANQNSVTIGTGKNVLLSFDPDGPDRLMAALIREDEHWILTAAGQDTPVLLDGDALFQTPFKPGLRYRIGEWSIALTGGGDAEQTSFVLLWRDQEKSVRSHDLKAGSTLIQQTAESGFRIVTQGRAAFEIHTDGEKIFHLIQVELDEHNEKKIKTLPLSPGEQFSFGTFTGVILHAEEAEKAMTCKDPLAYPSREIRHKLRLYFAMALLCLIFVLLLQVYAVQKEKYLREKYNICRELTVPQQTQADFAPSVQNLREADMYSEAEKQIYNGSLVLDDKYFRFLSDILRFENASAHMEAVSTELKHRTEMLKESYSAAADELKKHLSPAELKKSKLYEELQRKTDVLAYHDKYIQMIFRIRNLAEQKKWTELQNHLSQIDRNVFIYFSQEKVYDDAADLIHFHLVRIPDIYKNIKLDNVAAYRKENIAAMEKKLNDALHSLKNNIFFSYEQAVQNKNQEIRRLQTIADFAENLKKLRENDFMETETGKLLESYRLIRKYSDPEMKYSVDFLARCRQEILSCIHTKFRQIQALPPKAVFADTADAMIGALEQLDAPEEIGNISSFKRKINQHFEKIWNALHTDYKVALSGGNTAEAAAILQKMLDLGPCSSKYYRWAVQEQKKAEENKK